MATDLLAQLRRRAPGCADREGADAAALIEDPRARRQLQGADQEVHGGVNLGGIAALPVPAQYRAANDGLAFQFRRALDGALSTPGGCIQIVVSRGQAGSLFNYGLFAVEGQYCS